MILKVNPLADGAGAPAAAVSRSEDQQLIANNDDSVLTTATSED